MRTTYHVCLDVRGVLENWTPEMLRGLFRRVDGKPATAAEVKARLLDELSQGHLMLPMAPCEGFSYRDGCPGHPEPEPEVVS